MTYKYNIPLGDVDESKQDGAKSDDELVDDEDVGSTAGKNPEEFKDARFSAQGHVVKTDFETTMYL
jgi:hypothetical protein